MGIVVMLKHPPSPKADTLLRASRDKLDKPKPSLEFYHGRRWKSACAAIFASIRQSKLSATHA